MFNSTRRFAITIGTLPITLLLGVVCACSSANAQTLRNWTGGGSNNDWFNADNWDTASGPSSDDWLFVDFGNPTTATSVSTEAGGIIDISGNADVIFGPLDIGGMGQGTLAISQDSTLSTGRTTIGPSLVAVGLANLTGNTAWDLNDELVVGEFGDGTLNLSDGAAVNSTVEVIVGCEASSVGTINVSNVGSLLESSGPLTVGSSGIGSLNIADFGIVQSDSVRIGNFDSSGIIKIDNRGTLTSVTTTYVGLNTQGSLEVLGGGQVNTGTTASLGHFAGGYGRALVDGPDSLWDISSSLEVGRVGRGELTISNGGRVESSAGVMAENTVHPARVLVTGNDSTWSNSGNLTVGRFGDAEVRVEQGGTIESISGVIAENASANSTVFLDGYGSTWTNTGTLDIGDEGTAKLSISAGATVSNTSADIGDSSGSLGFVEVLGSGSMWTNDGALVVGRSGAGVLQVRDGAAVTSSSGVVSLSGTSAGSTATVDGSGSQWTMTNNLQVGSGNGSVGVLDVTAGGSFATDGDATLGNGTGSTGRVTVNGKDSSFSVGDVLLVGNAGQGTMTVDSNAIAVVGNQTSIGASGTLTVDDATLATRSLSAASGGTFNFISGEVTVDGGTITGNGMQSFTLDSSTLATMTITGGAEYIVPDLNLTVADTGTAVLNMPDGIANMGLNYSIGNQAGSDGTVNVSGSQGHFYATDELIIAQSGRGEVNLSGGAELGSDVILLASQASAVGALHASGAGTDVDAGSDLIVGDGGQGAMHLSDSAIATADDLSLGASAGGTGLVTVGDGSSLTATNMDIGSVTGGTGRLEIVEGGVVTSSTGGQVNLADGSKIVLDGGTFHVDDFSASAGATIEFKGGVLDIDGVFQTFQLDQPLVVPAGGNVLLSGAISGDVVSQPGSTIKIDDPSAVIGVSSSIQSVNLHGRLEIGSNTLALSSATPAGLGELTTISAGGIINALGSGVVLGSGDVLETNGAATINGRVLAGTGTVIQGAFTLGDATALDGFVSDGILQTYANTVTLLDANEATLGALTEFGSIITPTFGFPGTLEASNGAVLDFGKAMTGYGTFNTPDDPLRPLINNGQIEGESATMPITLSGYVKGVGTLDNVVVTGTDAPGFSPATVNRGSVSYNGTLEIEIGGTTPGTEFDQLNHILGAGVVDLDGTLDVSLINNFEPEIGQFFQFISSIGGIFNSFDTVNLPTLGGGKELQLVYGETIVGLEVVAGFTADFDFDGDVDGNDFLVWQRNPGVGSITDWQLQYGSISPLTDLANPVPEPACWLILVLGGYLSKCRRFC